MRDRTEGRLLTIGQLSELTGVPVRTIRFYSDASASGLPLLAPALRSASGYRLYDVEAASRLELIRTLRELGIDLPTIARVLAKEVSVADVARAQAEALEATMRALRLRQAVLRAVSVRDVDWEELELMNRLARLDAVERRRILDGYVDGVFGGLSGDSGIDGQFAQMMRNTFPELPEDPDERQVEAWVELVELIQDPDFVARSRRMALHSAQKRRQLSDEEWMAEQRGFGEILAPRAEAAWATGVAADSAEGRARATEIFEAWSLEVGRPASVEQRTAVVESIQIMNDERVNRFWHLVGVVGDRPQLAAAGAPLFETMQWLIVALRPEV